MESPSTLSKTGNVRRRLRVNPDEGHGAGGGHFLKQPEGACFPEDSRNTRQLLLGALEGSIGKGARQKPWREKILKAFPEDATGIHSFCKHLLSLRALRQALKIQRRGGTVRESPQPLEPDWLGFNAGSMLLERLPKLSVPYLPHKIFWKTT